ncbi:MAG: IS21 family transposase [Ornithinimicrobium sp.]
MLSVEDWAEIRRLRRSEGMPIKVIARTMGCSKNTVRKAVAATGPPVYQREPKGSIVDALEPAIRELLSAWPTMPATVIAERIGWQHSIRVLQDRVALLRPVYLPPDPASRTTYQPGELAQFDFWFPPVTIPVGWGQHRGPMRLPVLTMVSGYSRCRGAVLLPTRGEQDLYTGWWQLLHALGGVPKALVWDGEGAVGRWRARKVELTQAAQGFRGVLGTKVIVCKPADPEAKGLVERFHDHLERSFLPGREFAGPDDFNTQLSGWVSKSNQRKMRVLGCTPADRVEADRAAMLSLPPVAPVTGWAWSTRLPRDHYLRLDSNDYSIHPRVVGRRVEIRADTSTVQAWCEGELVAEHERCWARHQTISDFEHLVAAKQARRDRSMVASVPTPDQVQVRDLSSYDTAFGIDGGVA